MRILKISVENYKSLRSLSIEPQDMTVLVGANASGKSNLADCVDFISEVYRNGLEAAVAKKGGYENIAHRKRRRTKGAISVEIIAVVDYSDRYFQEYRTLDSFQLMVRHSFSFRANSRAVKAEFQIEKEEFDIRLMSKISAVPFVSVGILKDGDSYVVNDSFNGEDGSLEPGVLSLKTYLSQIHYLAGKSIILPNELLVSSLGNIVGFVRELRKDLGSIRVYQISAALAREFSAPTPRPELAQYGVNLPTVVDFLQKEQKVNWIKILQTMKRILPDLEDIVVDYTTSRLLGIFFKERHIQRSWNANEVSDGTIQTLALLVAIFDQRSTMLVIEEPENSVHPWIIKNILEACREASKQKQIMLTTHSPIVMNSVHPDSVWVMWRENGESNIRSLVSLDEDFKQMWEEGKISTFEFLDSGAVLEAIPPGPSIAD